ncbi:MAG: site-specific integrase [Candidatus Eisenbacteria sp.]|nr:site-specific integrase [Candidatus Eisenbacteria bacterium]
MAGVRKKPGGNGKFQAWFKDHSGRRKFFWGTRNRSETLRTARRLEDEHRQVALGYRPAPTEADKAKRQQFDDVREGYLNWGAIQGGRGGRPWSAVHARMRRNFLAYWKEWLHLETMADLQGCLPRVEEAVQDLLARGKSTKTAWSYADGLQAFCNWCVRRGYLSENPVVRLPKLDTSPRIKRRAMTSEEIHRLLSACPTHRRLLYETAFLSGLRAGELRALEIQHLDAGAGGVWLDAAWTKNRQPGFQPLSAELVRRLQAFAAEGEAAKLYSRFTRNSDREPPCSPLLYVPTHMARAMDEDLGNAGIPKWTPEGKLDFHAARTAYSTMLVESGATFKEAQVMARHSTPTVFANTYARTRRERLAEVAERVGKIVLGDENCAECVPHGATGAEGETGNIPSTEKLPVKTICGGGGNRTRYARFS